MGGLLRQYGLGTLGVNRVSNPNELKDGELWVGQNAALSTYLGRAALIKRPGVGALLWPASSGSVLAIAPLPFADPSPGTLITAGYPPYPAPLTAAPQNPETVVVTSTSITISWTKVTGATGYLITIVGVKTVTVGDVDEAEVTGLDPSTDYTYTVAGTNPRTGPASATGSARTAASETPGSGTFILRVVDIAGWTGANDAWLTGFAGSTLWPSLRSGSLILSSDSIELDGGSPENPFGLPGGFTITSLQLEWGGWAHNGEARNVRLFSTPFGFDVTTPITTAYAESQTLVASIPSEPTLDDLLGASISSVVAYATDPGLWAISESPAHVYVSGTYEVV